MAKPIEYLSGARTDFDESFDWYAERNIGAATGFASTVDDALEAIVEDPDRFPKVPGSCREDSNRSAKNLRLRRPEGYPVRLSWRCS